MLQFQLVPVSAFVLSCLFFPLHSWAVKSPHFSCASFEGKVGQTLHRIRASSGEIRIERRYAEDRTVKALQAAFGSDKAVREGLQALLESESDLKNTKGFGEKSTVLMSNWVADFSHEATVKITSESRSFDIFVSRYLKDKSIGRLIWDSREYQCEFSKDFLPKITPEQSALDLAKDWERFKNTQPRVCQDEINDSIGYIHSRKASTTVVLLHGFAISPHYLRNMAEYFFMRGFNVLVPRLKGHFNKDPRDLDDAQAEDWKRQVEEVYSLAARHSEKVIVAGFSLGGLLGAHLALSHPEKIAAFIGFAPAFRLSGKSGFLSGLGSLFGTSANDALGVGVHSCSIYIPASGGVQVQRLIDYVERKRGGATSAFGKFKVPSLVLTVSGDEVVDSEAIRSLVSVSRNLTHVVLDGGGHELLGSAQWHSMTVRKSKLPGKTAKDQVESFLRSLSK